MNIPFTLLPVADPVGYYFDALYQTGFYYQSLGWEQIIAAILLLIPRTSHLGALIFFPIILNITVLTNSVGFKGTWLLTIFMLLASTYLVCWDYDRWKSIIFGQRTLNSTSINREFVRLTLVFSLGSTMLFVCPAFLKIGNISATDYFALFIFLFLSVSFSFALALHHQFMKVSRL